MKQITKLPDPPSTNEPSSFADKADAFLGALPKFANEANALSGEINTINENVDTKSADVSTKYADFLPKYQSVLSINENINEKNTQILAMQSDITSKFDGVNAKYTKIQTTAEQIQQALLTATNGFINDDVISQTSVYSSKKIEAVLEAGEQKADQALSSGFLKTFTYGG